MKRTPLRVRPPADRSGEPGFREWKAPVLGRCEVCGIFGLLLRHHVVLEQHCRALHADPWDLRNALLIGDGRRCDCHRAHHGASRRISVRRLPDAAIAFVADLYGPAAGDYLSRHYLP